MTNKNQNFIKLKYYKNSKQEIVFENLDEIKSKVNNQYWFSVVSNKSEDEFGNPYVFSDFVVADNKEEASKLIYKKHKDAHGLYWCDEMGSSMDCWEIVNENDIVVLDCNYDVNVILSMPKQIIEAQIFIKNINLTKDNIKIIFKKLDSIFQKVIVFDILPELEEFLNKKGKLINILPKWNTPEDLAQWREDLKIDL